MKQRADALAVARGLATTQTQAQALILAGRLFSKTNRIAKPGDLLPAEAPLHLHTPSHPYVSRGGLKLAHALTHFALSPQNRIALDIGASTGGFTDVLLRNGAAHVHAIDVANGQLAWSLRTNPQVTIHERTNARHLTPAIIPTPAGCLACDASFIGLATLLPAPLALCAAGAWAVALIKPQFEAARHEVGPKGVIRDPAIHARICAEIQSWWSALPNWQVLGITESPITGPEGNIEFLIAATRTA